MHGISMRKISCSIQSYNISKTFAPSKYILMCSLFLIKGLVERLNFNLINLVTNNNGHNLILRFIHSNLEIKSLELTHKTVHQ